MSQSGFLVGPFLLSCVEQVVKTHVETRLSGFPLWDSGLKDLAREKFKEIGVSDQPITVVDLGRAIGFLGSDPNENRLHRKNLTDRALRYRANETPPEGEPICAFCGSDRTIKVGHLDGHEENNEESNLVWTCRSCNTVMGIVFKRAGVGRRTVQYNPSKGAKTLGSWMNAVTSLKGNGKMFVQDAVSLVHDTPATRRSQFAKEIWRIRRRRGTDRRPA